jgi:hypothetical protein
MNARFNDVRIQSMYNTCNWLQDNPNYQQWRHKAEDDKSTVMRDALEKAKREQGYFVLYYFFYRQGDSRIDQGLGK